MRLCGNGGAVLAGHLGALKHPVRGEVSMRTAAQDNTCRASAAFPLSCSVSRPDVTQQACSGTRKSGRSVGVKAPTAHLHVANNPTHNCLNADLGVIWLSRCQKVRTQGGIDRAAPSFLQVTRSRLE